MNAKAAPNLAEISDDPLELRLRHWGRVFGQRGPSEWSEDASLTPSPSAIAMAQAAAPDLGRPHKLGIMKHVNRNESGCPSRNWGQYAMTCTETRTPRPIDPNPQPEAEAVEIAAEALRRHDVTMGVVIRAHYCTRGTKSDKAELVGGIIGGKLSVGQYRKALELGKMWLRGRLSL